MDVEDVRKLVRERLDILTWMETVPPEGKADQVAAAFMEKHGRRLSRKQAARGARELVARMEAKVAKIDKALAAGPGPAQRETHREAQAQTVEDMRHHQEVLLLVQIAAVEAGMGMLGRVTERYPLSRPPVSGPDIDHLRADAVARNTGRPRSEWTLDAGIVRAHRTVAVDRHGVVIGGGELEERLPTREACEQWIAAARAEMAALRHGAKPDHLRSLARLPGATTGDGDLYRLLRGTPEERNAAADKLVARNFLQRDVAALLIAAGDASKAEPEKVRLGAENVLDTEGHKAAVTPYDLTDDELVVWLQQRALKVARGVPPDPREVPHDREPTDPAADVHAEAADRERMRRVQEALARMSGEDRAVLALWQHGADHKAVAEALGCSPGAARVRVHRAIGRVRDLLAKKTSL